MLFPCVQHPARTQEAGFAGESYAEPVRFLRGQQCPNQTKRPFQAWNRCQAARRGSAQAEVLVLGPRVRYVGVSVRSKLRRLPCAQRSITPEQATPRAELPSACRTAARKARAGEPVGVSGRRRRRLRTRGSRKGVSIPLEPSAKRREGRADRSRPALRGSPYRSSLPSHLKYSPLRSLTWSWLGSRFAQNQS